MERLEENRVSPERRAEFEEFFELVHTVASQLDFSLQCSTGCAECKGEVESKRFAARLRAGVTKLKREHFS